MNTVQFFTELQMCIFDTFHVHQTKVFEEALDIWQIKLVLQIR